MRGSKITLILLVLAFSLAGVAASASETTRFAVIVGNNMGLVVSAEKSHEPRPLSDIPLGGGTGQTGTSHQLSSVNAPSDVSVEQTEKSGSPKGTARREGAILWPPLALGISLLGPGVPQMVDHRYKAGGLLLGTFVGSLLTMGILVTAYNNADSDSGQSAALAGASLFGTMGFFTYSYSAVDAYYSHTQAGPGKTIIRRMHWDFDLSFAPSLAHTGDGARALSVGGGLGAGFAVHPNFVLGLRNLTFNYSEEIAAIQIAPEIRFRFQIGQKLAWSVGVGTTCQMQIDTEDIENLDPEWEEVTKRIDGAFYPYVMAQLHYFPAARWSLNLGARGGYSLGDKRFYGGVVLEDGEFSVDYIAGLSYYR